MVEQQSSRQLSRSRTARTSYTRTPPLGICKSLVWQPRDNDSVTNTSGCYRTFRQRPTPVSTAYHKNKPLGSAGIDSPCLSLGRDRKPDSSADYLPRHWNSTLGTVGGAGDYRTKWKVTSKVAFRVPSRPVLAEQGSVDRQRFAKPWLHHSTRDMTRYWTRHG